MGYSHRENIMPNFFSGALNGIKNTASGLMRNTKDAYAEGGMKGVSSAMGGHMAANKNAYLGGTIAGGIGGTIYGGYGAESWGGALVAGTLLGKIGSVAGAGVGGLGKFAVKNWKNTSTE
jgi:hypothetical protein